jgi:hypothetical protein
MLLLEAQKALSQPRCGAYWRGSLSSMVLLLLSPGTFACPVPICPSCPPPIIVDTAGEGFHLTSAQDGVDVDIAADDSRPSKQYERDDARVVVLRQYL